MPRNIAKALSPEDRAQQDRVRDMLNVGDVVTLRYVKRNGLASASHGEVLFFNGKPGFDTGSVTVQDPSKGQRTINLHNVTEVIR